MLGIREVSILNYPDGALDQVEATTAIRAVVSHIRRIQPDVVLTFGPEGAYGHPDHIAISQFTSAATACAADCGFRMAMARNPIHFRLTAFEALLPCVAKPKVDAYQTAFRKLTSMVDGVERQATPWPDWAVTTDIEVSAYWPTVWKAVCCHQTQLSIYERLQNLTESQQTALWGSQEFYRAYSSVNGGRKLETDLFEGLR